ncbi:dienelactone hydrolase family protein [Paenibacillus sp. SC116]|uniref:alpha/beta hydrolase n=1 Tax=Paenibacillus sp. SC116 TaxID=2968986 RepID=UPI00215A2E63|nr:alpha/beta hydrolase [Paenibacillus sp. SC116]MCR8842498.1 dienelactone hydrolase family protein [Paenibacillus sp. SC116]
MDKGAVRTERLEFQSGGATCVGYLYRLEDDSPKPCMIIGSGFGGTQDTPSLIAVATGFAQEGFCAFTFDYRHLGESGSLPRQIVSISGQQEDFLSAIRFIREHPSVDERRLGLWGSSLGGGHVISVASKAPEIKVVIAQIPYNGFPKKSGHSWWQRLKLLRLIREDEKRAKKGIQPLYIPVVGHTGELAVMVGSDASRTIAGMQSKTWRNEVAPRVIMEMAKYKPSSSARNVKASVMICYGEYDKETQGPQTKELIESLPKVEVKAYPVTHFEFYEPGVRDGIIADQIKFLRKMYS